MNIVMLTNTYLPHIGGVARSVEAFSSEFRHRGHHVLVVAPEFHGQPDREEQVIRIPALQNFNGSDFSVVLPVSGLLGERLNRFRPDIIHAHHPFLLGMTALRIARYRNLPLVFTHHTLYERYTHYVPADSPALQRFVVELATRYGNLSDQVFAPSESIATLLRQRGLYSPVAVVPTGVNLDQFAGGDGNRFRNSLAIPQDAFLVGHLGRLAPEKNLAFLTDAVTYLMRKIPHAHFLLAGTGAQGKEIEDSFNSQGLGSRLHRVGALDLEQQKDAYCAMDVFAFASHSETQGMVLTEAMACGVPVVALDANGAREVVRDGENGRLLTEENTHAFASALAWVMHLSAQGRDALRDAARATAERFSMTHCATQALAHYEQLLKCPRQSMDDAHYHQWLRLHHLIRAEWEILEGIAGATGAALTKYPNRESRT